MDVNITISSVGSEAGPFNLYSDADGFSSAFETNVPKVLLEAGYATALVPGGSTIIRIQSVSETCNYSLDVVIITTTTTTTTV